MTPYALLRLMFAAGGRTIPAVFHLILNSDMVENNRTASRIECLTPPSNAKLYAAVAEADEKAVDFIYFYLDRHDTLRALIDNLHVAPGHQQYGAATRLIHCATKWMTINQPASQSI